MAIINERVDVVVVGGGPAGLAAAAYMARGGLGVTVLERAKRPGGRAATRDIEGFRVNLGIHALYTGGPASRVLHELGVSYTAGKPGDISVVDGDQVRPFPGGPLSLLACSWLSVADKIELARILARVPRLRADSLSCTSVGQWIDGVARRPQVRRVLGSLARPLVYTSSLERVSADVLVTRLQRALRHPVHYVDGGWQTLVDGLVAAATEAGATIRSGQAAASLMARGARVEGVELAGGGVLDAAAVVLATLPRDAARMVERSFSLGWQGHADGLQPARLACLDVALASLPRPDRPVIQDLDRPLFLSVQSQFSDVAPPGRALVYAFKQLAVDDDGDPAQHEDELEHLLDLSQPGWRDVVVARRFLPHIVASGALPSPQAGGLRGRPSHRLAGIEGLYLVGDWVGPEGLLLDASLASARQVAGLLSERFGTRAPSDAPPHVRARRPSALRRGGVGMAHARRQTR